MPNRSGKFQEQLGGGSYHTATVSRLSPTRRAQHPLVPRSLPSPFAGAVCLPHRSAAVCRVPALTGAYLSAVPHVGHQRLIWWLGGLWNRNTRGCLRESETSSLLHCKLSGSSLKESLKTSYRVFLLRVLETKTLIFPPWKTASTVNSETFTPQESDSQHAALGSVGRFTTSALTPGCKDRRRVTEAPRPGQGQGISCAPHTVNP